MRYGCVSPTPEMRDDDHSDSESSDASFEIVYAETVNDAENKASFKPCVKFHDIFDVYPMDADVVARVTHNDDFKMSSDDKVVILPLAWTSLDQSVCSTKLTGSYVRFDVNDLPKTPVDQFYQLCYCTADGSIVGVSTPFFFREVHEEELMEFQKELNKEFWTFRSRFAVLTDLYWSSVKKNIETIHFEVMPENQSSNVTSEIFDESCNQTNSNEENENIVKSQTAFVTDNQQVSVPNDEITMGINEKTDADVNKMDSGNVKTFVDVVTSNVSKEPELKMTVEQPEANKPSSTGLQESSSVSETVENNTGSQKFESGIDDNKSVNLANFKSLGYSAHDLVRILSEATNRLSSKQLEEDLLLREMRRLLYIEVKHGGPKKSTQKVNLPAMAHESLVAAIETHAKTMTELKTQLINKEKIIADLKTNKEKMIADLQTEIMACKKDRENRLKECAKEYAKLCLKIRKQKLHRRSNE